MGLLDGMFGGNQQHHGSSPLGLALLGLLAYQGYKHRDQIADTLGDLGARAGLNQAGSGAAGGSGNALGGSLGDMLGGLFGGNTGGTTARSGLESLLDRFRASGRGDLAQSWIETGPERQVEPHELEAAVGSDTIDTLARQSGMSRAEVLDRLKTALPELVDKLTPDSRVPNDDEAQRLL